MAGNLNVLEDFDELEELDVKATQRILEDHKIHKIEELSSGILRFHKRYYGETVCGVWSNLPHRIVHEGVEVHLFINTVGNTFYNAPPKRFGIIIQDPENGKDLGVRHVDETPDIPDKEFFNWFDEVIENFKRSK